MAQNKMKAKPALPERVRSMEGLGGWWKKQKRWALPMNEKELALLERAFSNEIRATLEGTPRLLQTKATKLVDALVADGLMVKCVELWRGIKFEGYELTHAGRFAYCVTCEDEPSNV